MAIQNGFGQGQFAALNGFNFAAAYDTWEVQFAKTGMGDNRWKSLAKNDYREIIDILKAEIKKPKNPDAPQLKRLLAPRSVTFATALGISASVQWIGGTTTISRSPGDVRSTASFSNRLTALEWPTGKETTTVISTPLAWGVLGGAPRAVR